MRPVLPRAPLAGRALRAAVSAATPSVPESPWLSEPAAVTACPPLALPSLFCSFDAAVAWRRSTASRPCWSCTRVASRWCAWSDTLDMSLGSTLIAWLLLLLPLTRQASRASMMGKAAASALSAQPEYAGKQLLHSTNDMPTGAFCSASVRPFAASLQLNESESLRPALLRAGEHAVADRQEQQQGRLCPLGLCASLSAAQEQHTRIK